MADWHWRTEEAVRDAAHEVAQTMRVARRSLQDGKLETWAKNGELGLALVEAYGQRDAMQRRAESAEADWQTVLEERDRLLEAALYILDWSDLGGATDSEQAVFTQHRAAVDAIAARVAPSNLGDDR